MNRKAQSREEVPKAAIALILLVIVVIGAIIIYGGSLIEKIRILFPDFNNTQPQKIDVEIVRYDISLDKVQWYDGVNFYDFEQGKVTLNKKTFSESTLKNEFTNDYYYNSNLREDKWIELNNEINKLIYDQQDIEKFSAQARKTPPELNLFIISIQLPAGDLVSVLRNKSKEDRKVYGELALKSDNSLFLKKLKYDFSGIDDDPIPIQKNSKVYKSIAASLISWRDSVLEKPITISYTEKNTPALNTFCVKKYDNKYLSVDLSLPVSRNTNCRQN